MEDDLLAAMMDFDVRWQRLRSVLSPCPKWPSAGYGLLACSAGLLWNKVVHAPLVHDLPQDPAPPPPRAAAPGGLLNYTHC